MAFAVAAKWRTVAGYEVIDPFTVADALAGANLRPAADTPVAAIEDLAKRLAADWVVYGSASGAAEAKTLTVRCWRLAPAALGLDKTYKLAYWTDLRFALEDVVAAATGKVFAHPSETLAILDPASQRAWQANPNLIENGQFARGADGRLAGWEAVILDRRYNPAWSDAAQGADPGGCRQGGRVVARTGRPRRQGAPVRHAGVGGGV